MALVLTDKIIIFKREFSIDLLKERLITELKKQADNVTMNYKGDIIWDTTTFLSIRYLFAFRKLTWTKGRIEIKPDIKGGWFIRIKVDVTFLAIINIIFIVAGALLTMRGNIATVFGLLFLTFMAVTAVAGSSATKNWLKITVQKEIDIIRSKD